MLLQVALAVGFLLILNRAVKVYRAISSLKFLPGYRTLLAPSTFISHVLPQIPGIAVGDNFVFRDGYKIFESYGRDIYSIVSVWPLQVSLCLADAATIKEITSSRSRFPKPIYMYGTLAFFGPNVLIAEGELWKKHRKIAAPAFSEPNNKLVWNESLQVVDDLLDNVWADRDVISVSHCLLELTKPLTLFVIGAAAFGHRISWVEEAAVPPGHKLSFREALHKVSVGVFAKLAFPSFMMKTLPPLRRIDLAFDELRMYITEMIHDHSTSEGKHHDLLTNLIEANKMGDGVLADDGVIGNVFIFLLAGHETTANTLCFALALLALYPKVQEELFEHICNVIPEGIRPTYDHMPRLNFALAVIYETLRMFPPVSAIPKESEKDTTLVITNPQGEKLVVPVPKGTSLFLSTPGLHYNPRYWKNPHDFDPSRFLGDWNRDAFLPFNAGPRACLGRRFAELETVAVLSVLVRRYRIEVKEEPEYVGESFEAKRARILRTTEGISLTPTRVPLTFKRRRT